MAEKGLQVGWLPVTVQTATNSRCFCVLSNAKTRVERRSAHAKHITMLRIVESLNAALHVHALRRGVYSNGSRARSGAAAGLRLYSLSVTVKIFVYRTLQGGFLIGLWKALSIYSILICGRFKTYLWTA